MAKPASPIWFQNSYGGKFQEDPSVIRGGSKGDRKETEKERGIGVTDFMHKGANNRLERDVSFLRKDDLCHGCLA